ncbi:MAG: sigma-70 family RNA polymerase sigma factor [Pirellulales bacterium]|nr:sigma-70 family RNA polymerase sigma factor [Pirellulales bacterium]
MSSSPDNNARTRQFVRLLGAHEQELSGYVISLVPNWADADEVIQETKLRLWEQFDHFDATKDFGAWARAIAYFMVLAYRKRSQRASARFSQRFVEAVSNEAASLATEAYPLRQALNDCLDKLSQAARELLWACYAGRETIKDVAIRLGRSVRGTQRAVANIRAELQACIEKVMRKEKMR